MWFYVVQQTCEGFLMFSSNNQGWYCKWLGCVTYIYTCALHYLFRLIIIFTIQTHSSLFTPFVIVLFEKFLDVKTHFTPRKCWFNYLPLHIMLHSLTGFPVFENIFFYRETFGTISELTLERTKYNPIMNEALFAHNIFAFSSFRALGGIRIFRCSHLERINLKIFYYDRKE